MQSLSIRADHSKKNSAGYAEKLIFYEAFILIYSKVHFGKSAFKEIYRSLY